MVAGNRKHAKRRGEPAERASKGLDVARVVVYLITGDGNDVRPAILNCADDPLQVAPRRVRTHMEVGHLRDAQPLEAVRKIAEARLELGDAQST